MLQQKKFFWGKRPGFDFGDVLYVAVNAAFVLVLFFMTTSWHLASLAVLLVLLSKWRVLAVQPRFWVPNTRANLVDITVGMSTIGLMYQTKGSFISVLWALLYVLWLLILKPREGDVWVGLQAFWAQFLGLLVMFMIPMLVKQPLLVVILSWLLTWAVARHLFSNYEEPHYRILSLVWAFVITQLIWISLHWLQYYHIFDMQLSVTALVVAILSASLGSIYHTYKKQQLHRGVLLENGLFAAALIAIILLTANWSARL